jgi:hypothetical protein
MRRGRLWVNRGRITGGNLTRRAVNRGPGATIQMDCSTPVATTVATQMLRAARYRSGPKGTLSPPGAATSSVGNGADRTFSEVKVLGPKTHVNAKLADQIRRHAVCLHPTADRPFVRILKIIYDSGTTLARDKASDEMGEQDNANNDSEPHERTGAMPHLHAHCTRRG